MKGLQSDDIRFLVTEDYDVTEIVGYSAVYDEMLVTFADYCLYLVLDILSLLHRCRRNGIYSR